MVQEVCKEFNCSKELIIRKGRKNNSARDIAIYLARDICGIKCSELGGYFGEVSGASITMTRKRAMALLKEDRNLKAKFDRASYRIFNI